MTEQAALDENMPPVDEAPAPVEAPEAGAETPAEPAPAHVDDGFVETDNDKVQARINKITAEKYAEQRRAQEAEAELERLRSQQPTPTQPAQTGEPKLEDFDFDDAAYTAALVEYKVNQKAQEFQQNQQREKQAQEQAARQGEFNKKVAEFKSNAQDYDQVVGQVPPLPEDTLSAIMQSDNGPQLAYYLGKHLDAADELSRMSPAMAGIKLGQISAQITATPKPVTTSAAPAPIEPVGTSGTLPKDLSEMSMDEIYNM